MSVYMKTPLTTALRLCKIPHHTTPHHTTPHHTTLTSFLLFSGRRSLLARFAIHCVLFIHCIRFIHFIHCVHSTNYIYCIHLINYVHCIHFIHCIFTHCVHSTNYVHFVQFTHYTHFINTGIKNRCAGTRPLPALHDDSLRSPSALKGGDISAH